MKQDNFIGIKTNKLTVIKRVENLNGKKSYLFRCECENEKIIRKNDVISGKTTSCGCIHKKQLITRNNKHGLRNHKLYQTWLSMKARCYSKNNTSYRYYGARGIKVCDRWVNSFENFLEDMGEKPNEQYTLDRINTNDDYSPNNCKWSTYSEQNINRRYKTNKVGEKYISTLQNGKYFLVSIRRDNVRRDSKPLKNIDDAIKLRDLWLQEYDEDKNKWKEDTEIKNYNRRYKGGN